MENQEVRKNEPPGFPFWRDYGLHKPAPAGYNGGSKPWEYRGKEGAMNEPRAFPRCPAPGSRDSRRGLKQGACSARPGAEQLTEHEPRLEPLARLRTGQQRPADVSLTGGN